jgi:hypothetical protein
MTVHLNDFWLKAGRKVGLAAAHYGKEIGTKPNGSLSRKRVDNIRAVNDSTFSSNDPV